MRRSQLPLLALLIGALTACAGQAPTGSAPSSPPQAQAPQTPEEALRARATQFWEARVKGDLLTQYNLLEPRARERVTLTGYALARGRVVFLSYKIQDVELAGDAGRVTAMTTFRMNLPQVSRFGPWDQRTIMRWVRVDGVWYTAYDQQDVTQPVQAGEKRQ